MIAIILKIVAFIVLRATKIIMISIPLSIVLGFVCALIPGAATVIFIILKAKGLMTISWWWIIVPIVLDFLEFVDIVADAASEVQKQKEQEEQEEQEEDYQG